MALAFEDGLARASQPRPCQDAAERVRPTRILLVEDDELLGIILSEMLNDMGYDVCALATGETGAVAAAARYHPEMMIVDVNLAEGGGVEAVERILADGYIPHVFMSGDISRLRILKPDAVILRKPFKDVDLGHAIEHAIRLKAA